MCWVSLQKQKRKNLKDKYRKELKITREHRSGDPGGQSVDSDWAYFKLLDFLRDQMTPGHMTSNLEKQQHQESDLLLTEDEDRRAVDSGLYDDTPVRGIISTRKLEKHG